MMYVDSDFETALRETAAAVPYYEGDVEMRATVFSYTFLLKQLAYAIGGDSEREKAVIEADGSVDVAVLLVKGLGLTESDAAVYAAKVEKKLIDIGILTVVKKSGVILNTRAATPSQVRALFMRNTFEIFIDRLRILHAVFGVPYEPLALAFKELYAGDILEYVSEEELIAIYKGIIRGELSHGGGAPNDDKSPRQEATK